MRTPNTDDNEPAARREQQPAGRLRATPSWTGQNGWCKHCHQRDTEVVIRASG